MKQPYHLLLLLSLAASILSACSRGSYGGRPAPPARVLASPLLASAPATAERPPAPLASPASCPAAGAAASAGPARGARISAPVAARPSKKARTLLVNQLIGKVLSKQLTLAKSPSAEVAGTPTGLEGLGDALLKLTLLLIALMVVAALAIKLLVRLIGRWISKRKARHSRP